MIDSLEFLGCEEVRRDRALVREKILSKEGALLFVCKEYGETSFYVVNRIRKAISRATEIKKIKCGHAGTLDPLASGLLIIATRGKTKALTHLIGIDKTYLIRMRFGITSPSFDLERPIEITGGAEMLSAEGVLSTLRSFVGEHQQVPPIYSAIKQGGKAVYLSARRGETPEMTARTVTIYEVEPISVDLPYLTFRARVSKGTYIRSLVRDVAERLGTSALLVDLEREAIGPFSVTNALRVNETLSLIAETHS